MTLCDLPAAIRLHHAAHISHSKRSETLHSPEICIRRYVGSDSTDLFFQCVGNVIINWGSMRCYARLIRSWKSLEGKIPLIDTVVIGKTLNWRNNFQFRPSFGRQNIISISSRASSKNEIASTSQQLRVEDEEKSKHVVDELHHKKMMNWKNGFIVLPALLYELHSLGWIPIFRKIYWEKQQNER